MSLKFMHGLDLTLQEFVNQIPTCLNEDSLEKILAAARFGNCETIAVIDDGQHPVGTVDCKSLLCLLSEYHHDRSKVPIAYDSSKNYPVEREAVEGETIPVPDIALEALIQPVTCFRSQITLKELLPYFKDNSLSRDRNAIYLVTNSQGKLLGKLDLAKLLQHLLLNSQHQYHRPPAPLIDPHLIGLLEAIGVPLKLQTANQQTLYLNRCWREKLGGSQMEPPAMAQLWLEHWQKCLLNQSDDRSQSLSESYCPKGNNHLNPLLTLTSLPEINTKSTERQNSPSPSSSDGNHSIASNPISGASIGDRPWNYIHIPLDLANHNPLTEASSCYQLILAVPNSPPATDSNNSPDAAFMELNRFKDELLANISHELKSPLTGIVGLSSLLKEEKLGELNQRQLRYTELIYRSGRKLITIVSDLLDLTSLATGKLKLNLEPTELESFCRDVYQQAVTKLQAIASDNSDRIYGEGDFQLSIESEVKVAIADRLRLRQILSHLLTNSLKFSRPHEKIGIKINSPSNWIAITVWDNGVGIPEDRQQKLLQPLVETQNSPAHPEQIEGLGTVIAQQLARVHGGDISFISEVGRGSEFTLLLPSHPKNSDRPDSFNGVAPDRFTNSLVLIVETISSKIATITSWLRDLGYYPIVARTGTEALQKARQLQPGHILLNSNLPLLSGRDVLTLLKSEFRTKSSSVFLMSAKENLAADRARYQQADGFIVTPLTAIDLAKILPPVNKHHPYSSNSESPQLISRKALTILCLYPEPEFIYEGGENNLSNSSFNLKDWAERDWTNYYSNLTNRESYYYRIIEADGLEQAEMLARIWQLDTIVLDGSGLKEPLAYLRSLHSSELATLPLVTLDTVTTEAANHIGGLTVYPCLLPAASRNNQDLMQVIQIAAGIARQ